MDDFCERAKLQFSRENWQRLDCTWCMTARREFSIFIEKRSALPSGRVSCRCSGKKNRRLGIFNLMFGNFNFGDFVIWQLSERDKSWISFRQISFESLGNCSCVSYFSFSNRKHVDYTLLHRVSKSRFFRNFRILQYLKSFETFGIFEFYLEILETFRNFTDDESI